MSQVYIIREVTKQKPIAALVKKVSEWFDQLNEEKFKSLILKVAMEIRKPKENVEKILRQALKTAFKRKYGCSAANLLPDRKGFGFPEVGSEAFADIYFNAIKNLNFAN